jgi:hypothetical protein
LTLEAWLKVIDIIRLEVMDESKDWAKRRSG